MRNLLIAGATGLVMTLGAASAYAVPQNSPYATMVPPGAVDGYQPDTAPTYVDPNYMYDNEPMVEGRAAEVDPYYDPAYVYPDYGVAPVVGGGFIFGGGRHYYGGHFHGGHFGGGGHIHNAR